MNRLTIYILKRYLLLLAGLAIMAFGVAFSIKASLGTSPISSVPYVVSLFSPLLQILILRRNYHLIQLMQLPVAFFFGYLTDFGVWAVQGISCHTYWQQWIVCLIGILLVAAGVSLEVKAGVVVLAGEGVVLAICKAIPSLKFGSSSSPASYPSALPAAFRASGREPWPRPSWWVSSPGSSARCWPDGSWRMSRARKALTGTGTGRLCKGFYGRILAQNV